MKILKGVIHPMLFSSLKHIQDIIYYDGPLVGLFEDPIQRKWILEWVDSDDTSHRWMAYVISSELLETTNFRNCSFEFNFFQIEGDFVYAIDINGGVQVGHTLQVSKEEMKKVYEND